MSIPHKICQNCGQPAVLDMPACRRCGQVFPSQPAPPPLSPPKIQLPTQENPEINPGGGVWGKILFCALIGALVPLFLIIHGHREFASESLPMHMVSGGFMGLCA